MEILTFLAWVVLEFVVQVSGQSTLALKSTTLAIASTSRFSTNTTTLFLPTTTPRFTTTTTTSILPTTTILARYSSSILEKPAPTNVIAIFDALDMQKAPSKANASSSMESYHLMVSTFGGVLQTWARMGASFRKVIQGKATLQLVAAATTDAPSSFNLFNGLSSFIELLVAAVVCFILSAVTALLVPCLGYGFIKSVVAENLRRQKAKKKADREERASLLPSNQAQAKISPERGQKIARVGAEEDETKKAYSQNEKYFTLFLIVSSFSFVVTLLVVAAAASYKSNLGIYHADSISSSLFVNLSAVASKLGAGITENYSNASATNAFDYGSTRYREEFSANFTVKVSALQQSLIDGTRNMQSATDFFVSNAAQFDDLWEQLRVEVENFGVWLSNPVELRSNLGPGCTLSKTLPDLQATAPLMISYSTAPAIISATTMTRSYSYNQTLASLVDARAKFIVDSAETVYPSIKAEFTQYALDIQSAVKVPLVNLANALLNAQYYSDEAFRVLTMTNGYRSFVAYFAIGMAFPACIIASVAVLFKRMLTAKFFNIWTVLAAALFWTACGLSLGFSVYTVKICGEIRENQMSNWGDGFKQLSGPEYDIPTYIPMMYEARKQCYENQSQALLQLASKYVDDSSDADSSLQVVVDSQTFSQKTYEDILFYFNEPATNPGYRRDVIALVNSAVSRQSNFNNLTNIGIEMSRVSFGTLNSSLAFPLFWNSDSATLTKIQPIITTFLNGVVAADFGGNAACLSTYNSQTKPGALAAVTATFNGYTSRIAILRSKLSAQASAMVKAAEQIQVSRIAIQDVYAIYNTMNTNLFGSDGIVSAFNLAQIGSQQFAGTIGAALAYPVRQSVDCHDIGKSLFEVEDMICGPIQDAFDATYWVLGALAVMCTLHFYAVRRGISMLEDDSRWVIMALLIKNNYTTISVANSKDTNLTKVRKNATGTTYLQEEDFDIRI